MIPVQCAVQETGCEDQVQLVGGAVSFLFAVERQKCAAAMHVRCLMKGVFVMLGCQLE